MFESAAGPEAPEACFASGSPEAALVTAVDALAGEEPVELEPAAALERTRLLLAQAERLKALALRAVADVDTRQLHLLDGVPTASAWVKGLGVPGIDARETALARRLRSVPRVRAELLAGRLSAVGASQVAAAVAKAKPFLDKADGLIDGMPAEPTLYGVLVDGVCDQLAEQTGGAPSVEAAQALRAELEDLNDPSLSQRERVEACLLLFVQRSVPGLVPSGLGLLLDALLPAQHEARARRAEDERGLDLHRNPAGSGWSVKGNLDDETGELLAVALAAEQVTDPENPLDTAAWREGRQDSDLDGLAPDDWPAARPRPRSKRQQRHDALRSLLRKALDAGALGKREKAFPHIAVLVGLDVVNGVPGSLPGRTAHGARLARWQIRKMLSTSVFSRMVLDGRRKVVEVSHTQRTLTATERRILYAQWGNRCAGATCIRGPATGDPLVPHHVDLFSRTGTTSLDGALPLCDQEHTVLHDGHVIRLRDGRLVSAEGWMQAEAGPSADDTPRQREDDGDRDGHAGLG
jgi:hypothetical protein